MPYKLSDLKQAHGDGVLLDNVCQKNNRIVTKPLQCRVGLPTIAKDMPQYAHIFFISAHKAASPLHGEKTKRRRPTLT
jgi:hypothetical protein